ncbi:MAG: sugar transferase [bacterium]
MIKRLFDIIFSLFILIILSPVFLIIFILIKVFSRGPIFFTQARLGKNAKPFKIYKFRTMIDESDIGSNNLTLTDDQRITKIGKILRKYKLDELPQFVNVLKGEMSIVGPRPDVPEYYDLTDSLHQKVLSVKPGITCFAGIKYSLSQKQEAGILAKANNPEQFYVNKIFPDKIALNLKYVQEQSFRLDLKIIFQTVYYLFKIK